MQGFKMIVFFSFGGGGGGGTSLTERRSHEDELCLCSLTSRRRNRQTLTVEGLQLQERRGSRLLTESFCSGKQWLE